MYNASDYKLCMYTQLFISYVHYVKVMFDVCAQLI